MVFSQTCSGALRALYSVNTLEEPLNISWALRALCRVYVALIKVSGNQCHCEAASPVFSPHPDWVLHSESKNSPHHKGSPLCSCEQESGDVGAGTHRKGLHCHSKYRYFLNWSTRRASDWEWTEGCVCTWVVTACVCVCVSEGAIFWSLASSKGPCVLLSAFGTLGLADGAQKQSSLLIFLEQMCESESLMEGIWSFRYVHHSCMQWIWHSYCLYGA